MFAPLKLRSEVSVPGIASKRLYCGFAGDTLSEHVTRVDSFLLATPRTDINRNPARDRTRPTARCNQSDLFGDDRRGRHVEGGTDGRPRTYEHGRGHTRSADVARQGNRDATGAGRAGQVDVAGRVLATACQYLLREQDLLQDGILNGRRRARRA